MHIMIKWIGLKEVLIVFYAILIGFACDYRLFLALVVLIRGIKDDICYVRREINLLKCLIILRIKADYKYFEN